MDWFLGFMGSLLGFMGTLLVIILAVLLFVLALIVIIGLSKPKVILKFKESLELSVKLWFIKINITKLTSKPKKKKKTKIIHFDGTSFGELKEPSGKKGKKKPAKKTTKPKNHLAKKEEESDEDKKTIPEYIRLVTDILSDIKEPAKKILFCDIKRLYLVAADDSPEKAAVLFGNMNTAMGTLIFVCRKFAAFKADEENMGVECDFTAKKPSFDAHIVLTVSIRHIVICGFKAVIAFLGFNKNK